MAKASVPRKKLASTAQAFGLVLDQGGPSGVISCKVSQEIRAATCMSVYVMSAALLQCLQAVPRPQTAGRHTTGFCDLAGKATAACGITQLFVAGSGTPR